MRQRRTSPLPPAALRRTPQAGALQLVPLVGEAGFEPIRLRRTPKAGALQLVPLVGETGFEPMTSCAQGRRATKLRYSPTWPV